MNLEKLEFQKIIDMLCTFCCTELGKDRALQLVPANEIEKVESLLQETR